MEPETKTIDMKHFEIAQGLKDFFDNLIINSKINEWIYKGKTDIVFGSPGGSWEGQDGYLFEKMNSEEKIILRSIPNIEHKSYLVIESVTNAGQLYNMNLTNKKILKAADKSADLLESYSMTVGIGRKSNKEVKQVFEKLGKSSNIICTINYDNTDFKQLTYSLLEWSLVRSKVKLMIKNGEENTHNTINEIKLPHSANFSIPINEILYGPPGTGKTFKLQNEYYQKFTINSKTESKDDFIKKRIISSTWWEVIALILFREGDMTVPNINKHPFLRIKHESSNNNNSNTMIWAMLQIHTDPESTNVQYKNRGEPFIFEKLENSVWHLSLNKCATDAPQIQELSDEIDQFVEKQEKKENFCFTTFHQSYSYEDFIEGIKPVLSNELEAEKTDIGYSIEKGVFYRCCDEACKLAGFVGLKDCIENYNKQQRKEKFNAAEPFALFIDEINRANVSAVLGELITLIEEDKRLSSSNEIIVNLPYSKKPFGVPSNLHIIGTMNTADRSVEALDAALRRRFSFQEMPPVYNLPELDYEYEGLGAKDILKTINSRLEKLLDKDHLIGHSFFIRKDGESDEATIRKAFYDKIIPLLQEYFYGDFGKIGLVLGKGFVKLKTIKEDKLFADFDYTDKESFIEREVFEIENNATSEDFVNALKQLMNIKIEQEQ